LIRHLRVRLLVETGHGLAVTDAPRFDRFSENGPYVNRFRNPQLIGVCPFLRGWSSCQVLHSPQVGVFPRIVGRVNLDQRMVGDGPTDCALQRGRS
jgi:hypothetical protein